VRLSEDSLHFKRRFTLFDSSSKTSTSQSRRFSSLQLVEYNIMEIKQVFLKTRAEFGKQCIFDVYGPNVDMEIRPDPDAMANYIRRTHCNVGVQHTKKLALHEVKITRYAIDINNKNAICF